jgi:hypothetical protein
MSWQCHKQHVYGVQKVRWDRYWHVLYRVPVIDGVRDTYDRVTQQTAMRILRMIPLWSYAKGAKRCLKKKD